MSKKLKNLVLWCWTGLLGIATIVVAILLSRKRSTPYVPPIHTIEPEVLEEKEEREEALVEEVEEKYEHSREVVKRASTGDTIIDLYGIKRPDPAPSDSSESSGT